MYVLVHTYIYIHVHICHEENTHDLYHLFFFYFFSLVLFLFYLFSLFVLFFLLCFITKFNNRNISVQTFLFSILFIIKRTTYASTWFRSKFWILNIPSLPILQTLSFFFVSDTNSFRDCFSTWMKRISPTLTQLCSQPCKFSLHISSYLIANASVCLCVLVFMWVFF